MGLNIIDFSNGIRPEEIQENFDYLQAQLARERASVGGAGIASGLDITAYITNDSFYVNVSSGSVIDEEGNEVFIQSKNISIEPPILYQFRELITLDKDRKVTLKHRPYSLNRRCPAELLDSFEPELSGIYLRYENSVNQDDYIRVRDIQNKTIIVAGALSSNLEVIYNYTAKRIDALYLDKDFNIKVSQGTTDTTPSAPSIPVDAAFLIAYLEIDNEYKDETGSFTVTDYEFVLSLEDDLMRLFGGDKLLNMISVLNLPEDIPIDAKILSNSIEKAQF